MKKGWSLIEIIFVILIVGLISRVAINVIPDNTLLNNTNYLYNKILEKKSNAIGFQADISNSDENRSVCIKFTRDWLVNDENYSKVKFKFSRRVELNSTQEVVCFDYLGRPYKDSIDLDSFNNLLHQEVNITLKYNGKEKNLTIYPISGYVEIR
ncbi:MAG: hypothetical protein DSY40_01970 [Nautilia sp.]|nr:MAG: hypothetical protein DSY40_01970 [Nautilia sp.]